MPLKDGDAEKVLPELVLQLVTAIAGLLNVVAGIAPKDHPEIRERLQQSEAALVETLATVERLFK
jgi:hypothetical protein